ncbi:MAG: M48 family metallopeptidase [bacterium]
MKFNIYKNLITLLLIFNFHSSYTVEASSYNIYYQEIQEAKENDPYLKKRKEDIEDPFVKMFLNRIDIIKQMKDKDGTKSFLDSLNKRIFSGQLDLISNMILLNEKHAPKLFESIKQLSDKLEISMPLIFLYEDENFFNAGAISVTSDLSMILIGEKLLKLVSKEEFEAVIAHELSHIKKNHAIKEQAVMLSGLFLALLGNMFVVKKINNKFFNDGYWTGKCVQASGFLLFFAGWIYLMLKISQRFEKQADITALKVLDDPNSIISLMDFLEEKIDKKREKEFEFLLERVESEISKEYPHEADIIKNASEGSFKISKFFEKWLSTHPSFPERKKYLEQEAEKLKLETPVASI